MKKAAIFTSVLMAGSILANPGIAQERKNLFEVLFPKAHQKLMERKKRKEALANPEPVKEVRVKTSRYYAYKVTPKAGIIIKPLVLDYASVEAISEDGSPIPGMDRIASSISKVDESAMTADLRTVGKLDMTAERHLAKAVSDFYEVDQAYVWLDEEGNWNAKARSVQKLLSSADEYGLWKSDYKLASELVDDQPNDTVDTAQIEAKKRLSREISMTTAALRYAMDAKFGTVEPNRLSGYHDFPEYFDETSGLLQQVMGPALPVNTLRAMHPQHEPFKALQAELAQLSGERDDTIDLPSQVLIKPGNDHADLPAFVAAIQKRGSSELLEKHKTFLETYANETAYSVDAVNLVKDYQREAGLGADGIIGRNTAAKLAGIGSQSKVRMVQLAMERMRWLPDDLGKRHVIINQPEYRARYMEGADEKLSMRVVVGKKSNQTNFFYDEIEHVVYNPYWGVPRSIIVNEFRAKSIANPGYLDQAGYELTNSQGQRISSASVNWSQVGTYPKFGVRQPPGSRNALGSLKIMFPNKHSIYMHDTPSKHLFKRDSRAFSHGCVRLHDPQAMAAAVLGKNKAHVNANISQGQNKTEVLKEKVPVYVAYFTAFPQKGGNIKYFADMYGRDAHLLKAVEATRKARSSGFSS